MSIIYKWVYLYLHCLKYLHCLTFILLINISIVGPKAYTQSRYNQSHIQHGATSDFLKFLLKYWLKKQRRLTIPPTAPPFPTGKSEFPLPFKDTMLKSSNKHNTKLLELMACFMKIIPI